MVNVEKHYKIRVETSVYTQMFVNNQTGGKYHVHWVIDDVQEYLACLTHGHSCTF